METKKGVAVLLLMVILLHGVCLVAAASPARIASVFLSNVLSALFKWLWSLKSTTKTAISARPMMKFEGGYTVETVFDGSKLGIEPYSVEVTPSGELLVLDSENSNIYKISLPLSKYNRPKLVAGSLEGYAGHVDGKPREARMNHPTGFSVDDGGNIYVADTMNMAIRKISDAGVTTIAGGKWNGGSHVDGPSENAKFSTDFEVVYISSSCSLLVIDRGNHAIREIQLHIDDCGYQYENGFPLGIAVLLVAGFIGYMLALLQRKVGLMFLSTNESQTHAKPSMPPYQKPLRSSLRPPLIPAEDEAAKQEDEGFFTSVANLFGGARSSTVEIFGAIFSSSRKKPPVSQYQQHQRSANSWPMQETFVIPDDEQPPPPETRTPTPRKTYAFMSKEPEVIQNLRHGLHYNGWDGKRQQHLQQHRQYSSGPQTYYEKSCETTNEIVFGAVQEMDNELRRVEIKAVNYEDPIHQQYGLRNRNNYYDDSYTF
ncbi:uncharacterized protein [Typha angustifolia]|uniref:uncharacterized protein isoform X1 n=1 Tax=Typha angustifolia TaxID=59011 RepID=UPI003C2CA10A